MGAGRGSAPLFPTVFLNISEVFILIILVFILDAAVHWITVFMFALVHFRIILPFDAPYYSFSLWSKHDDYVNDFCVLFSLQDRVGKWKQLIDFLWIESVHRTNESNQRIEWRHRINESNLHLLLLNSPQIFGQTFDQIFGQVFGQMFGQGFDQGLGMGP